MLKVTFDKNVYEYVVEPSKIGNLDNDTRRAYSEINTLIRVGEIMPLISETILTYETIRKVDRKTILAHTQPLISKMEENRYSFAPNPDRHSGMSSFDHHYLPMAINQGFKIIPDHRLGKLTHPIVKKEWYYNNGEDFFSLSNKFSEVDALLKQFDVGYSAFANLIGFKSGTRKNLTDCVSDYTGSIKKLSQAISERSDGDSVALHITYGANFFCTNDRGISAGRSVFNNNIVVLLEKKYQFRKGSPMELLSLLNKIDS